MNNFNLVKKLGAGSTGVVCLVQNKSDGQQLSLKRVTCGSESRAEAALRFAMSLGKLQHPFVAKYREFFVEADDSSKDFYLHVVGDYYPCGDLSKLFKKRRKQRKAFGEILIKKWFGQLVEALIFIHDRNVVHGALKPTNVFLTEDFDVVLGDFRIGSHHQGTEASLAAGMAWAAPDDAKDFDERDGRGDVYALGCILLQLVSCHLVDEPNMLSLLIRSKSDPRVLEDLLQQIMVDPDRTEEDEDDDDDEAHEKYSVEMCAMIRTLMRLNRDHRPTAGDLQNYPFVQGCFELSKSALTNRSRRDSKDPVEAEAFHGSLPETLRFLASSTNSISQALSALKGLRRSFDVEEIESLPRETKIVVAELMRKYGVVNVEIASHCCLVALEILTGDADEVFGTEDFVGSVLACVRANFGDVNFLVVAARVLTILSVDEDASSLIGRMGGIQEILVGWRCFPHRIALAVICCSGLSSLAFGPENSAIVARERAVSDVLAALRHHGHLQTEVVVDNEEEFNQVLSLVEHACTALLSLSMDKDNVEYMAERSTIDVLIDVLLRYGHVARIVKCATLAMASLIEGDPDSADKFCHESGIPIVLIVRAYDNHKGDEEVVESVCSLILELTEFRRVCAAMLQHPILTMLKEVVQMNGENDLLLRLSKHAIMRLLGEKDAAAAAAAAAQPKVRSQSAKKARARRQSLCVAQNLERRPSREPQL